MVRIALVPREASTDENLVDRSLMITRRIEGKERTTLYSYNELTHANVLRVSKVKPKRACAYSHAILFYALGNPALLFQASCISYEQLVYYT